MPVTSKCRKLLLHHRTNGRRSRRQQLEIVPECLPQTLPTLGVLKTTQFPTRSSKNSNPYAMPLQDLRQKAIRQALGETDGRR
jgi:hypothetical protein